MRLNCTANGSPDANITWTILSDNITVEMPLTNITRQEEGGYRCTADNGVGSPDTKDVFITVKCEYWPKPLLVNCRTGTRKGKGRKRESVVHAKREVSEGVSI